MMAVGMLQCGFQNTFMLQTQIHVHKYEPEKRGS